MRRAKLALCCCKSHGLTVNPLEALLGLRDAVLLVTCDRMLGKHTHKVSGDNVSVRRVVA